MAQIALAAAALLGYRVRAAPLALVLLAIALIGPFIFGIAIMNVGGIFCGLILITIIIIPLLVGLGVGAALRLSLKNSSFSQRDWLPILIAILFPLACAVIEGKPRPQPLDRIETSRTINAPIDAAWASIMFYEEVEHTPPLILRIGLAHPLFTTGSSSRVGDIKTCIYNKGYITKEITEVESHSLLAFSVIEQQIGYERDVRLTRGSFAFETIDENRTRITLMTEYEPFLTPRFAWRWGENIAVRTLHKHVLEGMARKAEPRGALLEPAIAMRSDDEADR